MPAKKKLATQLTLGTKKRIWDLFYNQKKSINAICQELGVTYWQVYRIVNSQVKLDGKPRSDKGKSRNGETKEKAKWSVDDFEDLDDFATFMMMEALVQSAREKTSAKDKLEIAAKVHNIQSKIQERQLVGKLRRADAEVIAAIIRRYEPGADYKRCVDIYSEEHEKYMRVRNAKD